MWDLWKQKLCAWRGQPRLVIRLKSSESKSHRDAKGVWTKRTTGKEADGLREQPEQETAEKHAGDGRLALGQANAPARWTSRHRISGATTRRAGYRYTVRSGAGRWKESASRRRWMRSGFGGFHVVLICRGRAELRERLAGRLMVGRGWTYTTSEGFPKGGMVRTSSWAFVKASSSGGM